MSARLDALAAALGETHRDRGASYLLARCDHATLADAMRRAGIVADALVVDAPYSERTHAGHDSGVDMLSIDLYKGRPSNSSEQRGRREIDYVAWSPADVAAFVGTWHPLTRGWIASLTDHVLDEAWATASEDAHRYAFAPLACVETGSRFRAVGDGPPTWATQLCLSRPRNLEWCRWATIEARAARGAMPLPGAYVGPSERKPVAGGKPLWLMRAIVSDYSAPGDLVVDPCMGGGTTPVAAIELGRIAIGCEPDEGRYEIARSRCAKARPQLRMALDVTAERRTQSALDLAPEEAAQ